MCADGATRCRFAIASGAIGHAQPQICADDVAARNQLFQQHPQQRQVMLLIVKRSISPNIRKRMNAVMACRCKHNHLLLQHP